MFLNAVRTPVASLPHNALLVQSNAPHHQTPDISPYESPDTRPKVNDKVLTLRLLVNDPELEDAGMAANVWGLVSGLNLVNRKGCSMHIQKPSLKVLRTGRCGGAEKMHSWGVSAKHFTPYA